ncbi:tRNA lysidine(34) synthetase TilS [Blastomonas sp.]|uniref:tRNA lysidine(34) synthetase TilS n=1 Tax=Blastomonas sp. TaxID=1909299 RepID=UPI0035936B93
MPDVDDAGVARCQAALVALTGGTSDSLLLAVSGGPDSMALLDLVRHSWTGSVAVATVDHQLRAGSADEARLVAAHCASFALPHAILTPRQPISGNLQSAARDARYHLLQAHAGSIAARWIVTGHHADDQLETMLMRLARGSGVDGLAGVRARNGNVIRPLLGFRKAELAQWCEAHSLPHVEDPSNINRDFDRVRMRAALAGFDAVDPLAAVRSAAALAEAADALDWAAETLAADAIIDEAGRIGLVRGAYPAALLRRLVIACLQRIEPGCAPRGPAIDRLLASLHTGGQAMVGNVLCHVSEGSDVWWFSAAPPRGKRGEDDNPS